MFESGKKKSWLTIREWNPQEQPTLASKQENELIDIEKCYYDFNFIKVPNRQHIYFCAMGLIAKMRKDISLQALGQHWWNICFLKIHAILTICDHWNIKEITYKTDKNPLWEQSLEAAKEDGKE